MTVYITCQPTLPDGSPRFDFTSALEYGKLEILLPHTQSLLSPVPTVRNLKEKLQGYDPEKDHILMVGDPILCATVAAVACSIGHGKMSCLKWEKRFRKYVAIPIDITGRSL